MKDITIGWLGAGVMGRSMSGHMLKAGYRVILHTRSREKASELEEMGAVWKDTPKEVAESAEVIFSTLGYPEDVRSVILGKDGVIHGMGPGKTIVDMTTSSPDLAREIAREMKKRDAEAIDAPLSGGDTGARDASLAIMCGGEPEAFEKILPLLKNLGSEIKRFGEAGSGQKAKLANQILIASSMVGTVEALLYAERSNLNLTELVEVMEKGAACCWSLSNLGRRMISADWEPGFYVKHFIKDMRIALDDSLRMGLSLPGLDLAYEFYLRAQREGMEEQGTQVLMRVLKSLNQSSL